jgi:hypothetical protein
MNEVEAITGLIAMRTTVDTLDGLSQNEEEFSEEERETLGEAQDVIENWLDDTIDEAADEAEE